MKIVSGDFNTYKPNLSSSDGAFSVELWKSNYLKPPECIKISIPGDIKKSSVVSKKFHRSMNGWFNVFLLLGFVLHLFFFKYALPILGISFVAWILGFVSYKEEWTTVSIELKSGQTFLAAFAENEWLVIEKHLITP